MRYYDGGDRLRHQMQYVTDHDGRQPVVAAKSGRGWRQDARCAAA